MSEPDPSVEIAKAIYEGASEGAIRALLAPVTDFCSAVFGEPAREVGSYLAERVRYRRLQMQVKVFSQAQSMLQQAGIEPRQVSWKVLIPLLQGVEMEDPDSHEMHERWAAMLARAASGDPENDVLPSFPRILAELSPAEVALLEELYRHPEDSWRGYRLMVHPAHTMRLVAEERGDSRESWQEAARVVYMRVANLRRLASAR